MATNTILNSDIITKEALRVLHEKLSFIGRVNRQYDATFAASGAKNGTSLRIRKPARFTARTGATLSAQNFVEEAASLVMSKQYGVDLDFSSVDMSLSLDEFSSRIIEPAMAQLAAKIESEALKYAIANAGGAVYNASGITRTEFATAGAYLDNNSVPRGAGRTALVDPITQSTLTVAGASLFNDQKELGKEYLEGTMGMFGGFQFYSNPFLPTVAIGSDVAGAVSVSISEGDQTVTVSDLANGQVIEAGTAITFSDVYAVQYETKSTLSYLKQFVVSADATATSAGVAELTLAEPIYAAGARQNVSALPADSAVVTLLGGASSNNTVNLAFGKDFITFASADLIVPGGVHDAKRNQYEGISMRYIADYDMTNDAFAVRFDVLAGFVATRPEAGIIVCS